MDMMNRWIATLFVGVVIMMLFAGCAARPKMQKQVVVAPPPPLSELNMVTQKTAKQEKFEYLSDAPDKVFAVNGEGIAPQNTISPAQAVALAKRAAIGDAYRQMAEKLYGVQINAKDTIKNAALYDSRIVSQVNGLVKNATVEEHTFKDGLYVVRMELKMNGARWREIFAY